MLKLLYTPPSPLVSAAGDLAASAAFNRVWMALTRQDEASMFGPVKTAVDHGGVAGSRRLTSPWPGD